jgi:carbonic anhydrase
MKGSASVLSTLPSVLRLNLWLNLGLAFFVFGLIPAQEAFAEEDLGARVDQILATMNESAGSAEAHGSEDHGTAAKSSHEGAPHWTYEGKSGPEHWAELQADFRVCGLGLEQSPIDLDPTQAWSGSLAAIEFDYHEAPLRVLNNGHTIQANYAPGSGITVDGRRFELLQFHFHAPSEHTLEGAAAPMEVHFVHKNAEGQLAVVGVMILAGERNPVLDRIWSHMPAAANEEAVADNIAINAANLLPDESGAYYRYWGSLTTPPCSEGVLWTVLKAPIEASADQIQKFTQLFPNNARPVQSRHRRFLLQQI